MRGSFIALLLIGATPLRAQEPVPDTTDWRTYFPLEVGNEWQYRSLECVMDFRSVGGSPARA